MLVRLDKLLAEDPSLQTQLQSRAFVLSAGGKLCRPGQLFDPANAALVSLLDPAVFPMANCDLRRPDALESLRCMDYRFVTVDVCLAPCDCFTHTRGRALLPSLLSLGCASLVCIHVGSCAVRYFDYLFDMRVDRFAGSLECAAD